jgi:hypothetical protein
MDINVVLPAPLGPKIPKTSPCGTSKFIASKLRESDFGYRLERSLICRQMFCINI